MKHTPRPWRIEVVTDFGAPIIASDTCWKGQKRIIAKVFYHSGSEDPEVIANAHLIAAAPDLLEACNLIDFIPEGWEMPLGWNQIAAQIRKAIAKAERREEK